MDVMPTASYHEEHRILKAMCKMGDPPVCMLKNHMHCIVSIQKPLLVSCTGFETVYIGPFVRVDCDSRLQA